MSRRNTMDRHQFSQVSWNRSTSRDLSTGSINKSPSRIVKGIRLYNFSDLESYKKIHKPFFNNDKKVKIEMRLSQDKTAQVKAEKRIRKGKEFIKYDHNPFSFTHSKSEIKYKDFDPSKTMRKDLVHQITKIQKKKLKKQDISTSLSNFKQTTTEATNKISKQMMQSTVKNYKKQAQQFSQLEKERSKQLFVINLFKDEDDNLQDIVKIEEQSFFRKQISNMNLFRLLHSKEQFFGQNKTLQKNNFVFESFVEKLDKFKIPINRDLSKKARQTVIHKKEEDKLADEFLTFSSSNISFMDLLGVATGRISHSFVYNRLNNEKQEDEEEQSQVKKDFDISQILKRRKNRRTNIISEEEQKVLAEYLDSEHTAEQKRFKYLCQNRKNQINFLLDKEEKMVDKQIYHEKLFKKFDERINNSIAEFIESGVKYPKERHARNQRIEKNKDGKNRNQIIKMKALLDTFFLKKQKEFSINQLTARRK